MTARAFATATAACVWATLATSAPAHADTLTLADAVRMARAHHPTVEASRGQVLVARGRGEQAWAPLLPYLTGGIAYQPQTANYVATPSIARELLATSGTDNAVDTHGAVQTFTCRTPGAGNCVASTPPPTSWALHNFWTLDVGATWTLWDWGKSLYNLQGARAATASAEVGVRTAQRDVTLDVKTAFFAAIAADDQHAVAIDALNTYRAHVEQTKAFHDSGLRTGIDVATAESALASAAITLTRAEAQVATARAQLTQAIGDERGGNWTLVAPPDLFDLSLEDVQRATTAPDVLTDSALQRRTELQQLKLTEKANLATMRAARGAYLPALALTAGPEWEGTGFESLEPNLTVGLALSFPVLGMSPVAVHGQVKEAEGQLVVTRANTRAERDSIRAETLATRAQLAAARDEMVAAHTLVEAAARQRGLAEGRYQTGVGNVIELYDALLTDVNARFQMVQARLDLATARARLQHALGDD